ncbi:Bromodomain-like superfamily [Sesbania bispinosa]|nr:Bromodomain-like superfamily [Sesbania bispinosa]
MSFLQLQQQTREKCQEIWDRQVQSLTAVNGDENESDSEGNSDLDSFAEIWKIYLMLRSLKREKRAEEEIEDEAAEAAELCRLLMDDDEADRKKKKKARVVVEEARLIPKLQSKFVYDNTEQVKQIPNTLQLDGTNHFREDAITDLREEDNFPAKNKSAKVNKAKKNDITPISLPNKKIKLNMGEGIKAQVFKEKKPSRETFVCGGCGQLGHMRTNKNCPKYGEDLEAQLESIDMEKSSGKSGFADPSGRPSRNSTEKSSDKPAIEILQSSDKPVTSDSETAKSAKVNKIIIPKKMKPDDTQAESIKHAIVIRHPSDSGRGQVDSHKLPIKIRPPMEIDREQSHKKIIIKRTKEVADLELDSPGGNTGLEHRKTKRIVELSNFEKHRKQETMYSTEGLAKWKAKEDRRWWEEQEKRRNEARIREDRARRHHKEEIRILKEQERKDWYRLYAANKRRRGGGGEVGLANILESIVDTIVKDRVDLSYLFLKPVSKKEAPDYLDVIERPMDLSRIRERVRNMEYKSREDFRHDMWQITYNAHKYNDGRNPGIPPLADMLLEYCDYLLNENDDSLTAAEAGIEVRDF